MALTLSRRLNEAIVIDEKIVIQVVKTGATTRLRIVAPRHIPIRRQEIEQVKEEERGDTPDLALK